MVRWSIGAPERRRGLIVEFAGRVMTTFGLFTEFDSVLHVGQLTVDEVRALKFVLADAYQRMLPDEAPEFGGIVRTVYWHAPNGDDDKVIRGALDEQVAATHALDGTTEDPAISRAWKAMHADAIARLRDHLADLARPPARVRRRPMNPRNDQGPNMERRLPMIRQGRILTRSPDPGPKQASRRGRPTGSSPNDPQADAKLLVDWEASDLKTYAEFARARGMDAGDVETIVDRARQARTRRTKSDE